MQFLNILLKILYCPENNHSHFLRFELPLSPSDFFPLVLKTKTKLKATEHKIILLSFYRNSPKVKQLSTPHPLERVSNKMKIYATAKIIQVEMIRKTKTKQKIITVKIF